MLRVVLAQVGNRGIRGRGSVGRLACHDLPW
jgi:hypothetical protein